VVSFILFIRKSIEKPVKFSLKRIYQKNLAWAHRFQGLPELKISSLYLLAL